VRFERTTKGEKEKMKKLKKKITKYFVVRKLVKDSIAKKFVL